LNFTPPSVEVGEPDAGELGAIGDADPHVVDFELWILGE
jgi:hypothetical protein